MAIKFGKAFGMTVTVFSTSPSKEKQALEILEADWFIVSKDPQQMKVIFFLKTQKSLHMNHCQSSSCWPKLCQWMLDANVTEFMICLYEMLVLNATELGICRYDMLGVNATKLVVHVFGYVGICADCSRNNWLHNWHSLCFWSFGSTPEYFETRWQACVVGIPVKPLSIHAFSLTSSKVLNSSSTFF